MRKNPRKIKLKLLINILINIYYLDDINKVAEMRETVHD